VKHKAFERRQATPETRRWINDEQNILIPMIFSYGLLKPAKTDQFLAIEQGLSHRRSDVNYEFRISFQGLEGVLLSRTILNGILPGPFVTRAGPIRYAVRSPA
jgi:hypothetical protein